MSTARAPAEFAHSRRVALVVAVAWFMQNLDTTIIVTSLPQIARTFDVDPVDVTYGITANVVAGAAFIPLGGWLADRVGARRVFSVAIVVFVLASVACAASTTLWMFVLARVAQGMGGALMVPVGRILVLRSTQKGDLLRATAYITWPGLVAPVIAPVLGGALTTWLGWQAIFLVNVPIGVTGLALVVTLVPKVDDRVSRPFDGVGCGLLVLSLGTALTGMSAISQPGALALGLGLLLVGAVLCGVAVWWLRRAPEPLVGLGPLRVPTFVTATLTGGNLVRIAISATPFLLPLMAQEAWGFSPVDAGNVVLIYMAGNLLMKTVTTPLLRAFGFRNVSVGNGVVVASAIAAMGFLTAETPTPILWVVAFVAGCTRSLQFTALNTLTFADIGPEERTSASTLFSMMQQVALGVGVALAAIVLSASGSARADGLTQPDFTIAFTVTAVLALIGAVQMATLTPDAGQLVTGHQPRRRSR